MLQTSLVMHNKSRRVDFSTLEKIVPGLFVLFYLLQIDILHSAVLLEGNWDHMLETIFSVVVGGLIAIAAQLLSQSYREKIERRMGFRRQKEKLYIDLGEILSNLANSRNEKISDETVAKIHACRVRVDLYASDDIKKEFYQLLDNDFESFKPLDDFFILMRNDLAAND